MERGFNFLTDEDWNKILIEECGLTKEESGLFIPALRLAESGRDTVADMARLRENPEFVQVERKVFKLGV